jgi:small-conductance mechanosensitive channel
LLFLRILSTSSSSSSSEQTREPTAEATSESGVLVITFFQNVLITFANIVSHLVDDFTSRAMEKLLRGELLVTMMTMVVVVVVVIVRHRLLWMRVFVVVIRGKLRFAVMMRVTISVG